MVSDKNIRIVFLELLLRRRNPSGTFDRYGQWHATNSSLIVVQPLCLIDTWAEMRACRTRKYVTRVAYAFCCSNITELRNRV